MQQTRKPKRVPDLRASGRFSKAKKTLMLLSMVAPGALWLLLLRYLPMGGIILAFKNYKIYPKDPTFLNNLIHSKWVSLDNFKFLFTTGDSWVMIRNTLAYNIVFIILGVIIPVAFAIMMSELSKKFVAKTYQTLMFFPYFLSWVVVSYFLNAFIDAQYGLIPMAQRSGRNRRLLVHNARSVAIYHRVRKPLEERRLFHGSVSRGHHRHRPDAIRGRRHRRRKQMAADPACNAPESAHDDCDSVHSERWQNLQR